MKSQYCSKRAGKRKGPGFPGPWIVHASRLFYRLNYPGSLPLYTDKSMKKFPGMERTERTETRERNGLVKPLSASVFAFRSFFCFPFFLFFAFLLSAPKPARVELKAFGVQTGVRQDFFQKSFPNVDAGMDGDGDAFFCFRIKKRQMASFLAVFMETIFQKETNQFLRGKDGQAAQAGMPMQISSTWTKRSLGAIFADLLERDST